jgi:hypothetical protein
VIEDDQDVLSMLVKHLAYIGYEVITARWEELKSWFPEV